MSETKVAMMFFMPPEMVYNDLEKKMRSKNTYELPSALSDICVDYWETYCAVHAELEAEDVEAREQKIQSYFTMQALVKLLKEWGWWDKKNNLPYDWTKEESNANTSGAEGTNGKQDPCKCKSKD
jgi:hypothetical protein